MGIDIPLELAADAPLVYSTEELEHYPEIQPLLAEAGLGEMLAPVQLGGRNPNWMTKTSTGASVFVKVELNSASIDARTSRVKYFYDLLARSGELRSALVAPTLYATTPDARTQVYEVIPNSPTAQQRLVEGSLKPAIMYQIGAALGTLHTHSAADPAVPPVAPLPSSFGFGALDDVTVPVLSAGQLQALNLLHGDSDVHSVASGLLDDHEVSGHVGLIHGDLRLDQILVSADGNYSIIDWEEFGIGPLSRDAGSLIGDIINTAVLAALCGDDAVGRSPASSIELGLINAKEIVAEFCAGYRRAWVQRRPSSPPDLDWATSVARYAGWHQFDRLMANAESVTHLPSHARALAGIGRSLMLEPTTFISEFEMDRIVR
ncbi:phosphotransferase [Nocardia fluminea]|uniref:phosphotransferase n=1 Tax=Nocardia fluminea TaxID=134984 RepID=UPI0033F34DFC